MEEKQDMTRFKVGSIPTLYYIPDFITNDDQFQLLNNIYQAPVSKWKTLKYRRLQNWGGVVHEKGLLCQDLPSWLKKITSKISDESGLFPSTINHVLINEYLPDQGIMPHQDGPAYFPVVAILSLGSPVVMDFTPHSRLKAGDNTLTDNSEDDGFHNHDTFSILLEPRSLLIFKDMAYSDYLHGIKDTEVQSYSEAVNVKEVSEHCKPGDLPPSMPSEKPLGDTNIEERNRIHRTTKRVSLTCRQVLKVHKNLFRF